MPTTVPAPERCIPERAQSCGWWAGRQPAWSRASSSVRRSSESWTPLSMPEAIIASLSSTDWKLETVRASVRPPRSVRVSVSIDTWPGAPSYSKVRTVPSGDGSPWKTPWKPCSWPSSLCTKRHLPPSRTSFSLTVMVYWRGPSHCCSSSGSVYARYTRSRGASNSQVMMICGMPGSAVICVLAIVVSSRRGRPTAAAVVCRFPLRCRKLQCREQLVEPLVALVPEPLVARQPGGYLAERLGLQVAEPGGGALGPRQQARPLQHLQVPGDRWLGHAERRGELRDRRVALGQPGQDRPPGRIRERPEHQADLVCLLHNHPILERTG